MLWQTPAVPCSTPREYLWHIVLGEAMPSTKSADGRKMKLLERETPGHSWVSVNKAWKTVRIRNRKIQEKLLKIAQL